MMTTTPLADVALLALIAGAAFGVLRGLTEHRRVGTHDARRLLDERLARGEIDEEQYRRARALLR
jgi:putative membrane protein